MNIIRWIVIILVVFSSLVWYQACQEDRLMLRDTYEKVFYTVRHVVKKFVYRVRSSIQKVWPYEKDDVVIQKLQTGKLEQVEYNEAPCVGDAQENCDFNKDFFNDTYFEGLLDMDSSQANVDLKGLADSEL